MNEFVIRPSRVRTRVVLVRNLSNSALSPIPEHNLPLRIRELIRLEQYRFGPALPLFELEIIPVQ